MDKKWILIMLLVILIFMIGGIYIFSNHREEINEVTNGISNENINQDKEQERDKNLVSVPTSNEETTNSSESTNNNDNLEERGNNTEKKLVSQVSPSGFMGSSLYRVVLYSNGDVYVEKFDGNGYENSNIIEKDLIAKNAKSIEAAKENEHYGEIFVKGGEVIHNSLGWINFD